MKFLTFLIISLTLMGCDGTETASNPSDSTDLKFSSSEFSEKILFSEEVRGSSIQDGFVLRFEETEVKEIGSLSSGNNSAVSGEYDWVIENDKLQVTYPSSVVCTTTKTEEEILEFNTTGTCSGGTPANAKIEGRLIKPVSFIRSDLSNKEVTIELGNDKQETIDFNSDGTTFLLTGKDNGVTTSTQNGTFEQSIYTNVVRLEYPDDQEYSLFILLDNSLSSGTLMDLRYTNSDDTLQRVRIYKISANNVWTVTELFDSITIDN